MARVLFVIVSLTLASSAASYSENAPPRVERQASAAALQRVSTMKIKITVGDNILIGTLNDSKAAQDFASLLPLSLILDDYNGTEKISNLPKRLSIAGSPPGFDPSVGNITYYAPWGNVAFFYKDFGYSTGLISLGVIDSGADILARPGRMQATVELAGPN